MNRSRLASAITAGIVFAISSLPAEALDDETAEQVETRNLETERPVLAKQILDRPFPEETRIAMFQSVASQMQGQMMQSLSGIITDEGALAVVKKWQDGILGETDAILQRNVPLLMEAWAVAYADMHTKQELEDILAFVSTPSGQAFMRKANDILSHPVFAQANQVYIDETMSLVTDRMPELVEEIQAYEASKQPATD